MKTNIFAINGTEDVNRCGLRAIGGHRAIGMQDIEEALIRDIDEDKMSDQKFFAYRFLLFLGENRLTLDTIKQLPEADQQRLLSDFRGTFE